ncbi:MAG: AAA family ATPase [Bacteroidales bacterium]|nr:AAA family ATPase [Bacteroidales bacterium]
MIKSIRLTNFYSFKETTININNDLNILIGINGSGKSNFLKSIRLLKEGVSGIGLKELILEKWGGIDGLFFKGETAEEFDNSIGIEFIFDHHIINHYGFFFRQDIIYKIVIVKSPGLSNYYISDKIISPTGYIYLDVINGHGVLAERVSQSERTTSLIKYDDFDPQELTLSKVFDSERYGALNALRKAISDIVVYDYFDTTPNSPIRKAMKATSGKILLPDGSNLPQILNTIKISHKKEYKRIVELLNDVNANFRGFDFHFLGSGNFELMLDESGLDSAIHVTSISDGTLRYLCLLSILYNPERGKFICIDEPEVGLHPDMALNVTNAIKEAAKNSTMLIATHSENILDAFEVEHARVFEKEQDNSTIVNSYKTEEFEKWYDEYNLGKMWRKGDIGGNRW